MITQTEYENQTTPKPQPVGSVIIERYHTWSTENVVEGKTVQTRYYHVFVQIGGTEPEIYSYRTHPRYHKNGTLYTMDRHGNCKSASVFREPLQA